MPKHKKLIQLSFGVSPVRGVDAGEASSWGVPLGVAKGCGVDLIVFEPGITGVTSGLSAGSSRQTQSSSDSTA